MRNIFTEKATGRLIELGGKFVEILKSLHTTADRMQRETHISSATFSRMKRQEVSAHVYLRLVMYILRLIDRRMERGQLPPDFERGLIKKILRWYNGEGEQ